MLCRWSTRLVYPDTRIWPPSDLCGHDRKQGCLINSIALCSRHTLYFSCSPAIEHTVLQCVTCAEGLQLQACVAAYSPEQKEPGTVLCHVQWPGFMCQVCAGVSYDQLLVINMGTHLLTDVDGPQLLVQVPHAALLAFRPEHTRLSILRWSACSCTHVHRIDANEHAELD